MEVNRLLAVNAELNVFDHLTSVELYVEECLYAGHISCFSDCLVRERPKCDRSDHTYLDAKLCSLADDVAGDT